MLDYHVSRCDSGVTPTTTTRELLAWAERRHHTVTLRSITNQRWSISWDPRVADGNVGRLSVVDRRTGATISLDGDADRLADLLSVLVGGDPPGGRAAHRTSEANHWRHLATHDQLTGIPNRLALTMDWPRLATMTDELIILDVDHFKTINDTHGHHVGDALLTHLATALTGHDHIYPYRLGGDEFALLSLGGVDAIAPIVGAVNRPITLHDVIVTVSVSVGILLKPGRRATNLTDALRLADLAMYAAKRVPRDAPTGCAVRHWIPEITIPESPVTIRRKVRDASC